MYDLKRGLQFFNSNYTLITHIQYRNKKKLITRTSEQIKNSNKKRFEIGMESYGDYQNKVVFFKNNKQYCFPTGNTKILFGGKGAKKAFESFN
jgi:predicted metallo-beta-lactamase superfamily hydrolase